jgi:hypothetical protein
MLGKHVRLTVCKIWWWVVGEQKPFWCVLAPTNGRADAHLVALALSNGRADTHLVLPGSHQWQGRHPFDVTWIPPMAGQTPIWCALAPTNGRADAHLV